MPSGLFYLISLDRSIFQLIIFNIALFREIFAFYRNSVDPDQTPRSVASDLDLHCLLMSLLWDTMHKWIKVFASFDDSNLLSTSVCSN